MQFDGLVDYEENELSKYLYSSVIFLTLSNVSEVSSKVNGQYLITASNWLPVTSLS
jgi:hypothetical protein